MEQFLSEEEFIEELEQPNKGRFKDEEWMFTEEQERALSGLLGGL